MAETIKHAQPANPTKEMRVQEALREALRYEMARDSRVFVMGEDVALFGGAYGVTRGLMQEFGENRVLDTPISEAAVVGLRSEEHTAELQSHRDLHSFPTRRSSDLALFGGAYGVTRGLMQEFGENRVLDTPISEAALVGL